MNKSIDELKIKAKKIQRSAAAGNPQALDFLKSHRGSLDMVKRKTCLNILATKLGFKDWSHAKCILSGEADQGADMGTTWYSDRCSALLNMWFSGYSEARDFLKENPHLYLLPYKKQYIVVDLDFIKTIGLYEGQEDLWLAMEHDLVKYYASQHWHELMWQKISQIQTL